MDIFSSINNNIQKNDYSQNIYQKQKTSNHVEQVQEVSKHIEEKKSKDELKKELQKVIEELNEAMNPLNQDLKFRFNDKVDELIVEVVDKKNDKVIRQFPPPEALKLMEKMRELIGLLFDKKG
ncbi:MAG: flagellar protein FlaG [Nautiliaceae bacterium]